MFKKYGLIGILLIIVVEINFFLKIQPLASWYFPIIWLGFILVIDAIIYKLRKHSPLMNQPLKLAFIFLLSIPFWYVFEFFNVFILNWSYTPEFTPIIRFISAMFIFPAVYETYLLILTLHLFDNIKLHKSHRITKKLLYSMILLGMICFVMPIFFPKFTFPLVWLTFFFILDPINYLHKQPSIIGHLKDRGLKVPLSLLLAGIIAGFLWEFWNYWAVPKWTYDFPFINFFKIFEMPVLGYFGYFPFAFELYAMYWFIISLFKHKKHLLEKD